MVDKGGGERVKKSFFANVLYGRPLQAHLGPGDLPLDVSVVLDVGEGVGHDGHEEREEGDDDDDLLEAVQHVAAHLSHAVLVELRDRRVAHASLGCKNVLKRA